MKAYLPIARLVWPLALGMLNNALLQFADRAFLARESMASIEAALPASMLALVVAGFFQSVVAYSGTFVAQYHGAGDRRGAFQSYRAGTVIALFSGLLAVMAVPLGRAILPFVSGNAEVVAGARTYYSIVSIGAVAVCGQMAAASYFTGMGLTRLVFWVNVLGNLFNVALDPILIFGMFGCPRLGIAGAAWATVAATALQWLVLAQCVRRVRPVAEPAVSAGTEATQGSVRAQTAQEGCVALPVLVRRILRFGIPSGAYAVLNLLSFTVFVFVTGRVGDLEFAVSNACFSVNYLLVAPVEGFAVGAATLVAQAQGRGDSAAARLALKRTLVLALAVVALLSLGAVAFHRSILSLFAPPDANLSTFYGLGKTLFLLMAAWQMFDAADVVISGALKGAGDTRFVMWWMVAVAFGIWLPIVWVAKCLYNTMPALWGTMVVYVVIICIGEIVRWRRGKWAGIKLV